jgi:hypothetical protein
VVVEMVVGFDAIVGGEFIVEGCQRAGEASLVLGSQAGRVEQVEVGTPGGVFGGVPGDGSTSGAWTSLD